MLTRKHFIKLAEILAIVIYHIRTDNKYAETVLLGRIIQFCSESNSNFDSMRFESAVMDKVKEQFEEDKK